MGFSKEIRQQIKNFILSNIELEKNPYNEVPKVYKISRQTIYKYLKELIDSGYVEKSGKNNFKLKFYNLESFIFQNRGLEEDVVYDKILKKYQTDRKSNVLHILQYAFTEMLNNAIEHSGGSEIKICYAEDYFSIYVLISDNGIGIFRKIMKDHNLNNENEAIFELKKGKLTSDTENHSGEGIFFTSKVVDYFKIDSYNKTFSSGHRDLFYHFAENQDIVNGTMVGFTINKNTDRTTREVFEKYTTEYVFDKTEITIALAKEYFENNLISRSVARRILENVEKFKIVILDFENVETIGQAFADEIFRVFKNRHKEIKLVPINMNSEVKFMIGRVSAK